LTKGGLGRRSPTPAWVAGLAPAAAVLALQQILWPVSAGTLLSGVILGALGALHALGLALIWRANRVLNIAQSDLGTLPATLVLLMMEAWKLPYLPGVGIGLAAAVVLGSLVELLIIRRFFHASRLILLVATVGVSQLLTFAALVLPRAFGRIPANRSFDPPFEARWTVGAVVFSANDLLGVIAAVTAMVALTLFLLGTDVGTAIRASADRADRASMLGIPVRRLQTQVWAIATVLSFVAIFFTAGITALVPGYAVSLLVVLRSLAALVMGRMTRLGTIATSAVALGVLEAAIRANHRDANLVPPLLALIILATLLAQRRGLTRADRDEASSWRSASEIRPVPAALAALPEVRLTRWIGGTAILVAAVVAPHLMGTGTALKAGAVLVFATIGLSLVVLTGWAGQVSLGQMTFVGVGSAIAAWCTVDRGLDPLVALVASGVVGAAVAVVIGLPALRLRGLYLAVTTLALALAASAALFSNAYWEWIPRGTFARPAILGRISLDSATRVYYLALVVLLLAILAVRGVRRSRTGRVLVAIRDNEDAAAAFGVSVVGAKLTAFALSGFVAAVAGAVFAFNQASFRSESYTAEESITVFVSAVIGGLGSIPGAVLGALFSRGAQWLLPGNWRLFAASTGVLVVLMIIPEGLGGTLFRVRDLLLRRLALRRGIDAPSLTGNTLAADEPEAPPELAA
jgi:branched-chain amino acid transport system permease protein